MKQILLKNGMKALIDDKDFQRLSVHSWSFHRFSKRRGYVARWVRLSGKRKRIFLHHEVMSAFPGLEIDHKDRNTLNNQRANLRRASSVQNRQNTTRRLGATGFRGVRVHGRDFAAQMSIGGRTRCLGIFPTAEEAAKAYDAAAAAIRGEFSVLNVS